MRNMRCILLLALVFVCAKNACGRQKVYGREVFVEDTAQRPIEGYKFGHFSTAMEVIRGIDLKEKNVIITGGYTGTGLETTRALSAAGANILVLARDPILAAKNLKGIARIEIRRFDLLSERSIDSVADNLGKPLHILINHAGIINTPQVYDSRGYEYQFATNMLGHFALTAKLFPALKKAKGARVINLTSRGHRAAGVSFDDINWKRTQYDGMKAYASSKTALVLFTLRLDAMGKKYGIRAFAVHPGPIPSTDLFAESLVGIKTNKEVEKVRRRARLMRALHITGLLNFIRAPKNVGDVWKNVSEGAATSVWAATSPDLDGRGGLYLEDCNIAPPVRNDEAIPFGVRQYAIDSALADKLWQVCEEMTGVRFEID